MNNNDNRYDSNRSRYSNKSIDLGDKDVQLSSKYLNTFYKLFSVDGGGCRNYIATIICLEIERRLNRNIADIFSHMCGTSVGAVLIGKITLGNSLVSNGLCDM